MLFLSINTSVDGLRFAFIDARNDEYSAEKFLELIQKSSTIDTNTKLAYIGAAEIILAKYQPSITERISWVKRGKANLDKAIAERPNNFENRILRLMIQHNAPIIIRYRSNIQEDKEFVIRNYRRASAGQKSFINRVVKEDNLFTAEEAAKLK